MADEELRLRFGDYPPVGAPSVTTTLHAPAAADAAEVEPRLAALGAEPVRAGDGSDPRPVAWLIPAPADGRATWVDLVTAFPTSGLWPLIVDGLEGDAGGAWHTGKFTGPDDRIGEPREILERTRLAFGVPDDEDVEEFEEFDADGPWTRPITQLAGATTFPDPVTIPVPPEVPALLLVPTTRPADAPARLGWTGASDRELTGGDVTAVLRLWEKKFNAVLLVLDITEVGVFVPSPPTGRHAELMACEFAALSPEDGGENWETFGELMEMAHRRAWWVRFE